MNKLLKILLAIIGGCDVVFGIFFPIALGFMIISFFALEGFQQFLVLFLSLSSATYKGISLLPLK